MEFQNNMNVIISVIIPTYREWDILTTCLNALEAQNLPPEFFEILIINNSINHPLPEGYALPKNAKVVDQPIKGSYAARNMGIKLASGDFFAFTDSDCTPEIDWISKGLAYLMRSNVDLVGGKIVLYKPVDGDQLTYLYEDNFSFNQKKNVERNGQSITANLFCSREVILNNGPFLENLLSGGDFEWTRRATSAGFNLVYGSDVIVKHPSRRNLSELIKKKKRTIGGMYFRFFKQYSAAQKFLFTVKFLRPHITILAYKHLSFTERVQLFFATWYVEFIGMKEMLLLHFMRKPAQRS
ncbi:glycosyltransferase family A protein [Algoriphagus sp. D3-2-R+10]|uniref:glycosyltransferase n=1 Tax=Algoriphagus aurantiacus TaxID=3103948 RepID=UPI002B38D117|nr:glycosyltransferase family A protein [Algoriphagus sp. D3-2-R+10]MEB2777503.1 glycosyltransferase family A protein [Algoriphagus sp. D3-2-R+10]